ncbi:MAG: phospholipase [Pseudomonadota bacterium]
MIDPHASAEIVRAGPTAATARTAAIALHGRGAAPSQIIDLMGAAGAPDVAVFAPAAAGNSWWPYSFLAPYPALEPHLLSALLAVDRAFDAAHEEGFDDERIVLLGFSQGACLALEYTARRGRKVKGVLGFSGGLLGTGDEDALPAADLNDHVPKRFDYQAKLSGHDIHIGTHEGDPLIPLRRVKESEAVLRSLGADCKAVIAPGPHHMLIDADLTALRRMVLATS